MAGLRVFVLVLSVLSVIVPNHAHVQYVEKEAVVSWPQYTLAPGDDFSWEYPFDLDAPGTLKSNANPMEDGRFATAYLAENDYDVVKFTINEAPSTANFVAWTPACAESKDIYVNAALLGPLSDSRFQPLSAADITNYNIMWADKIPAGYGVILGINAPVAPELRPTLIITLPVGEIPNRWFLPYNSGELDADASAFRAYQKDDSTGKGGCLTPPQRCPGAPYPFEQTNPFCPHLKVGNFCGPKPWRWINEVDLGTGTYYGIFWERNGRATDVGYFMGWNELLRFGTFNRTECQVKPKPAACSCGSRYTFELPDGCVADFPEARERIKVVYQVLTGQANLHTQCTAVPEVPASVAVPPNPAGGIPCTANYQCPSQPYSFCAASGFCACHPGFNSTTLNSIHPNPGCSCTGGSVVWSVNANPKPHCLVNNQCLFNWNCGYPRTCSSTDGTTIGTCSN